jgi:hypothetical protein
VLGNIERAAKSWREGDDFTAHLHLAYTGLRALDDFPLAAHRLRMAKGALDHGATPLAIFQALRLDARYIDASGCPAARAAVQGCSAFGARLSIDRRGGWGDGEEESDHAPAQEGPGREATRQSPLVSRMPRPVPPLAPSVLSALSARQVLQLSLFAGRVLTVAGGAARSALRMSKRQRTLSGDWH